jgi:hypothetical protein
MQTTLTVSGLDVAERRMRGTAQKLPLAIARALNRAIGSARTQARRRISAETGLQAKFAVRGMAVERATGETLTATLRVSERIIPLFAYTGAKGFRSGKGIAGQSYRLGAVPAGAFFAEMRTGHRGVFARAGRARFPIRELPGPPLPRVIVEKRIFEALQGPARQTFERRLEHETRRLLATGDV